MSLHSSPVGILQSATPHEMLTRSRDPTKGIMEATSRCTLVTILNSCKNNDLKSDYQGFEEHQVGPALATEEEDDLSVTALQKVTAGGAKLQMANSLEKFPCMAEKAVEQLFGAATLSAYAGVLIVVYEATKHVFLDEIRTALLGKTIDKHVKKYFERGKAGKAPAKTLLRNHGFLAR